MSPHEQDTVSQMTWKVDCVVAQLFPCSEEVAGSGGTTQSNGGSSKCHQPFQVVAHPLPEATTT